MNNDNEYRRLPVNEYILRVRIHPLLKKKLKIISEERNISTPKVVAELIREFIEHDELIKKTLRK